VAPSCNTFVTEPLISHEGGMDGIVITTD
jgi:hypothetical protein